MNQEISKTQGGKGQITKIPKKQEGKNGEKKKKRFFFPICGGSHNRVFSIIQEHPHANPPSLRRTHLYGGIMPIYMPAFHVM
jgi:hypothetical protein